MRSFLQFFFQHRLIRYLFSGSIGAFVHIGTVYVLSHIFLVWYQYATIVGFILALGVSFTMQKFFTFKDSRTNVMATQSSLFTLIAVTNLVLNSGLMYVFVEQLNFVPVIAQFCAALILAVSSFLLYSKIFRHTKNTLTAPSHNLVSSEDREE